MTIPTAETVAQVKMEEAMMGTHANRRCSKARTMVGYSIWIHLNWRETKTPIKKLVRAQAKEARRPRETELKVESRREELKKKAI